MKKVPAAGTSKPSFSASFAVRWDRVKNIFRRSVDFVVESVSRRPGPIMVLILILTFLALVRLDSMLFILAPLAVVE